MEILIVFICIAGSDCFNKTSFILEKHCLQAKSEVKINTLKQGAETRTLAISCISRQH
jgi:hypothetical protein